MRVRIKNSTGTFFFSDLGVVLITVGLIYDFITSTLYHFGGNSLGGRFGVLTIVMPLVMICFIGTFIFEERLSLNAIFLKLFLLYGYAILVTIFSFMYSLYHLPFVIINMTYWVVTIFLFYVFVKHHGIPKCVSFIACITLVICFICFMISYNTNQNQGDYKNRDLLMNNIYYVLFLLPLAMMSRHKVIVYFALMLCFIGTFFSEKRGALLMIVTIWIVFLYYNLAAISGPKKILLILFTGCVAFALYMFAISIIEQNELSILERMNSLISGEDNGSGRFDIWSSHFIQIKKEGFFKALIGRGYRSESNNSIYKSSTLHLSESHNDFLQILFDYGIIGLFGIISFLFSLGRKFYYAMQIKYKYTNSIIASVILFGIGSMGSMCIIYPYWFIAVCVFWGMVLGDLSHANERKEK